MSCISKGKSGSGHGYATYFNLDQVKKLKLAILGGAQGIGAAVVTEFYLAGANVFFGDWNEVQGFILQQELQSQCIGSGNSLQFRKVDVRDYNSQLGIFDAAYEKHGKIDIAVSCAAIGEPDGWFDANQLDLQTVRKVRKLLETKDKSTLMLYK